MMTVLKTDEDGSRMGLKISKVRLKYVVYCLGFGMLQFATAALKISRPGATATLAGRAFHWTVASGKNDYL